MSHEPLSWIEQALGKLDASGLKRCPCTRGGPQGARIALDSESLINFGSNDYLGLAADKRLGESVAAALSTSGWGSGASPLVTGRSESHVALERHLAAFEETEAALLFPSGYAANTGTIASLVGPGDVVFSDAKNHASIIDGCRLSRAQVEVYSHRDIQELETRLKSASQFRKRLIVSDSLFSMDGDLAPVAELAYLSERYKTMLMLDEAHATGVFGTHGRGVAEHHGIEQAVHVRVGTLSKALGSVGGFVAGSRRLIDWLTNRARSLVFSTAMPAAACRAAEVALQIVCDAPQRRAKLLARSSDFRQRIASTGWNCGQSESQIVPLMTRTPDATMDLHHRLRGAGFFVPGIRPPTVPPGESLLRISLCFHHSDEHVSRLVQAIRECWAETSHSN